MRNRFISWFMKSRANIITTIGLITSVWFFMIILQNPEKTKTIFILALISALTDFIDGPVARKLNIKSSFGSFMDRIRDRVFVYPALVILAIRNKDAINSLNTATNALIGAIIFLEVLIFLSGAVAIFWHLKGTKNINLDPNNWGKKKVFTGFMVVLIWIFSLAFKDYSPLISIKNSIFLIDFGLILMIFWGVKSLEEYAERSKGIEKNNKAQ